jgi:hypothetical protein
MPGSFPADVVKAAFIRSDGECECVKSNHKHSGRCNNLITFNMRYIDMPNGWEACQIDTAKPAVASNCRIVCMECCKSS